MKDKDFLKNFHIGRMIKEKARQKQVSSGTLANAIRLYQRNADKIYKKEDFCIEVVIEISSILECNLLEELSKEHLSHLPFKEFHEGNYTLVLDKTGHFTVRENTGVSSLSDGIHIGKYIRAIAKSKGLTMKEIGKRLGITHSNVSCLYRREKMSVKKLILLSNILKVNLIEEIYLVRERIIAFLNHIAECTISINEQTVRIEHSEYPDLLVEFHRKHR